MTLQRIRFPHFPHHSSIICLCCFHPSFLLYILSFPLLLNIPSRFVLIQAVRSLATPIVSISQPSPSLRPTHSQPHNPSHSSYFSDAPPHSNLSDLLHHVNIFHPSNSTNANNNISGNNPGVNHNLNLYNFQDVPTTSRNTDSPTPVSTTNTNTTSTTSSSNSSLHIQLTGLNIYNLDTDPTHTSSTTTTDPTDTRTDQLPQQPPTLTQSTDSQSRAMKFHMVNYKQLDSPDSTLQCTNSLIPSDDSSKVFSPPITILINFFCLFFCC